MILYEVLQKKTNGSPNFYRIKIGSCFYKNEQRDICVDSWNLPNSPTKYITIDSNPILSTHIVQNDWYIDPARQKKILEMYLLDYILCYIVNDQYVETNITNNTSNKKEKT